MNLENYIIKKRIKLILSPAILLLFIIFICYSLNWQEIILGFSRIGNLFSKMYPFDKEILPSLYAPLFETICIAVFSSVLAIFSALVILPLVTNILFNFKIVPTVFSAVFSIFRTIPFLIIAAILVSLFSTGNFSGFISMYIINFLMATKLLKEYAEEVDNKHIDSLISLGVNKLAIYKVAILSNIKNEVIALFFLVLESSIRGASVLGLVGAGGIGQKLWRELNHLRYDRVIVIIILLIMIIVIVDILSLYFRKRLARNFSSAKQFLFAKKIDNFIIISSLILSLLYVFKFLNINLERFNLGLMQLKALASGLVHPDSSYFSKMLEQLLISAEIAFLATFFASITAIFMSYLAMVEKEHKVRALVFKFIINVLRTFPAIIIALIFFRGFGPGNISCFFALYFYTVGVMSKMFSEILEQVESNIIYSVKSLGISNFISYIKIIFLGYFPEFITIALYRFEMNIKNSAILGMVGAGGIGQLLVNNIEFRNWNKVSTLLIGLCTLIIIVENISYYIRNLVKR